MSQRTSLLLVLATALAAPLAAQPGDVFKAVGRTKGAPPRDAHRDGEVIVSFRAGADDRDIDRDLRAGAAAEVRRSRASRRVLVTLQPGTSVEEAVRRFSEMPEVEFAEPNGIVRKSEGQTFKPDDRFYKYQWNLTQIDAERTWGIQKGSTKVAVAVLDSGVAYEDYTDPRTGQVFRKAPDWGSVTFLPGYDFVNGDAHPNDDEYHGTHVASTIAEATNNGIGLAGVAFNCAIMPVKVLDDEGNGSFFDLAEGIDYAANYSEGGQKPVKVINMSLGADSFSQSVKTAAEKAAAAGVLLVAAAGNSAKAVIDFPASLSTVLAVGALDARKERAFYASWGPELEFVAPGGDCDRDDNLDGEPDCIFQQMPDPDFLAQGRHDQFCYCGLDGTSMATPHVSAVAALLFSQGWKDADAVKAALEQTAERLGGAPEGGRNDTFGYGLVRPALALPGLGLNTGPSK
jgi:serine protease